MEHPLENPIDTDAGNRRNAVKNLTKEDVAKMKQLIGDAWEKLRDRTPIVGTGVDEDGNEIKPMKKNVLEALWEKTKDRTPIRGTGVDEDTVEYEEKPGK